jgi:hypothetical protein
LVAEAAPRGQPGVRVARTNEGNHHEESDAGIPWAKKSAGGIWWRRAHARDNESGVMASDLMVGIGG